jgi:hypothetical protein
MDHWPVCILIIQLPLLWILINYSESFERTLASKTFPRGYCKTYKYV